MVFGKRKKEDPDSAWKEQHDAISTNVLYTLINVQKEGKLFDIYVKTFESVGTKAVETYIQQELVTYLYNGGDGHVITELDYRKWKMDKLQKKHPEMRLEEAKTFDDPFNKFEVHTGCWALEHRGAVGETMLHLCILGGSVMHLTIAKILLRVYPKMANDIYEADEYYGESCLHIAIVNGNFEIVKLLVENGADVNQRATGRFFLPEDQKGGKTKSTTYEGYAYYGEFPVAFAACFGHEQIYDYLIDNGADPDMKDNFGNTALHMMVISNQIEMVKYAIKHHVKKANMELPNDAELTPLTLASKLGRHEIFREIIELQSSENWRYSNITCSTYPLAPIDTVGVDGKTNWSAALIYITNGETEEHLEMLDGGVIKQLLHSKWKTYIRRRFIERLVLAVLHLATLSVAIYLRPDTADFVISNDPKSIARYIAEIIVSLYCLVNVISQCVEIRSQGILGFLTNQLSAPAKLIFNISCILILLAIPMRFLNQPGVEMVLIAIAAPMAWAILLFFARGIPTFGPFIVTIYKMFTSDMVRFVIIFIIFLVQFSQGFYFLFKDIENDNIQTFKTIESTIMQLFQMTLGEFKYEDFDHTRMPHLTKAVFAVFAILVPILLLNMLIAMMGNTYQQIISRSEKEWKRQWAKIIIVLERSFSPKQLKRFRDMYSSELPNSQRGIIVIKTSRKTKARQRKGAIGNWKKLGNEVKALIKEQKLAGLTGPLDLTSEEIYEKVTERQLRKRRSTIFKRDDTVQDEFESSDGLMSLTQQLAWERDIDFSKGKNLRSDNIMEEDEHRTPSPATADRTPLLKDKVGVVKGVGAGSRGVDNLALRMTAEVSSHAHAKGSPAVRTHKVHPDPKGDAKAKPDGKLPPSAPKVPPATVTITKENTISSNSKGAKKKTSLTATPPTQQTQLRSELSRPPSARSSSGGSKESKDSAFCDGEKSRRTTTNLALTGSRSSLNSASSLTSLLHAWDGKDQKSSGHTNDTSEF